MGGPGRGRRRRGDAWVELASNKRQRRQNRKQGIRIGKAQTARTFHWHVNDFFITSDL